MLVAAFRGPALALRRSAALLLAGEAAVGLAVPLGSWIERVENARHRAEVLGQPAPDLPYPAWLPDAYAPFAIATFFGYPLCLILSVHALPVSPHGVLPRLAKRGLGALLALALAGLLTALSIDRGLLLLAFAPLLVLILLVLPLVYARECRGRGRAGAALLWHAVAVAVPLGWIGAGVFQGLQAGPLPLAVLPLLLRLGALAWTLRVAGFPLAPPGGRVRPVPAVG